MNKYRINQYVPIIKGNEGYIIGGNGLFSIDDSSILSLDDSQEELIQAMIHGEIKTQEELQTGFGEEAFSFLATHGLFVTSETDINTIYSRNKAYYYFNNMGNIQKKLSSSSVLILGCGGIGTHVAWNMCVLGVGKITLVDFDYVEESNLNRQLLYNMDDIGKVKVEVLRENLLKINPNITINSINQKIWSEDELEKIVCSDHFDLILKSLDSPALFPLWLDQVCNRHKIPYISGITVSTVPMIGPTFVPDNSACYTDFFETTDNTYQRVSGVSQSLGVIMYHISSEISLEAFRLLTGKGKLKFLDCIYTEDVITGKEMIIYPRKSKLRSKEQERPLPVLCTLLLILSLVLVSVLSNCTYFLFFDYVICLLSPFMIYHTRDKITRSTLLNFLLFFPIYATVMLTKTNVISISGLTDICSVGVTLFSIFSIVIISSQIFVNLICRKLR